MLFSQINRFHLFFESVSITCLLQFHSHDVVGLSFVHNEELSVAEEFLAIGHWQLGVFYRCGMILVVDTAVGVVVGVVGGVEAIIFSPSTEHNGSLCVTAAGVGCSLGCVVHNAINRA